MPPRKTKAKASVGEFKKPKGLFDHLKELTEGSDPLYWVSLTDKERSDFSPYMVNRFLSMNPEWIELVDDFQPLTIGGMPRDKVYTLYHDFLPKDRVYLKYVKPTPKATIPDAFAEMLVRYFECSKVEMGEYFALLMRSEQGKQFIVELMQAYGTEIKTLKKLRTEIGV